MIIINIIILYFIQITHTDDFPHWPTTGTRLVIIKTSIVLTFLIARAQKQDDNHERGSSSEDGTVKDLG